MRSNRLTDPDQQTPSRGTSSGTPAECTARLLVAAAVQAGVDHAGGVPDSGLSAFLAQAEEQWPRHYAPREDVAVGVALGVALTGRRPLVFMKNAGLGTSLDALLSGVRAAGVPMLLVIGWAGVGGDTLLHHVVMGSVTLPLLAAVGIPTMTLQADRLPDASDLSAFISLGFQESQIHAVVVQP